MAGRGMEGWWDGGTVGWWDEGMEVAMRGCGYLDEGHDEPEGVGEHVTHLGRVGGGRGAGA